MSAPIRPVDLAKAYRLLNHGPTVLVSARHQAVDNVMAAAWCCALDFDPPKLTLVLDKATRTRALIEGSGLFAIQIPTVAQLQLTQAVGNTSLADEPAKLALAGVDGQHLQLVGIGVARGGQHVSNAEASQLLRRVFHALDLKADGVQPIADFRNGGGGLEVVLEPGQRELHARAPTPADKVG